MTQSAWVSAHHLLCDAARVALNATGTPVSTIATPNLTNNPKTNLARAMIYGADGIKIALHVINQHDQSPGLATYRLYFTVEKRLFEQRTAVGLAGDIQHQLRLYRRKLGVLREAPLFANFEWAAGTLRSIPKGRLRETIIKELSQGFGPDDLCFGVHMTTDHTGFLGQLNREKTKEYTQKFFDSLVGVILSTQTTAEAQPGVQHALVAVAAKASEGITTLALRDDKERLVPCLSSSGTLDLLAAYRVALTGGADAHVEVKERLDDDYCDTEVSTLADLEAFTPKGT